MNWCPKLLLICFIPSLGSTLKKLAFRAVSGQFFHMYRYIFLKQEKPEMDDFRRQKNFEKILLRKYFEKLKI